MSAGKEHNGSGAYSAHNKVRLIRGGSEYFDLLEQLIDSAKLTIHIQIYIFDSDSTGERIGKALLRAAARGVEIFVLVDGYASRKLSRGFVKQMKDAGIKFRRFQPIFHTRKFYFGRRAHHKVVVVDSLYCLVGGLNISDRYNDLPDQPAWLDWAIYCEGEASTELFHICQYYWNRSGWGKKRTELLDQEPLNGFHKEKCFVRVRLHDWVKNKLQIYRSYVEMLKKAKSDITIMSSYFLPQYNLRKYLTQAAKRGVKIRIITAGQSDVPFTKQAERYVYEWLFQNGIEVYEYTGGILHGKISTYDNKWVTAGSFNLNNLSAYASIEINIDVLNDEFAKEVNATLDRIIQKECVRVTPAAFQEDATFVKRIWNKVCYAMINAGINLSTFYYRQKLE